jgi:hypothetical protein
MAAVAVAEMTAEVVARVDKAAVTTVAVVIITVRVAVAIAQAARKAAGDNLIRCEI